MPYLNNTNIMVLEDFSMFYSKNSTDYRILVYCTSHYHHGAGSGIHISCSYTLNKSRNFKRFLLTSRALHICFKYYSSFLRNSDIWLDVCSSWFSTSVSRHLLNHLFIHLLFFPLFIYTNAFLSTKTYQASPICKTPSTELWWIQRCIKSLSN